MKLTKQALDKIDNPVVIAELQKALDFSELWVKRLILQNRVNGPLTTFAALSVIRRETGLPDDKILTPLTFKKVAKGKARVA